MSDPMALDRRLLDILVCPEDKGPLVYREAEGVLYNPRLRRIYRIVDDIPVMLIDEATRWQNTAIAELPETPPEPAT